MRCYRIGGIGTIITGGQEAKNVRKPMLQAVRAVVIASFLSANAANAATITINFDSFPGMNFLGGAVPLASQLSNQLVSTTGAVFSTEGGSNYVAVANLEIGSPGPHAPSPPNGIGGVTAGGDLFYGIPILVSFFDPANPTTNAETNFVSVRGDLRGIPGNVFLVALDSNGNQIASDTQPDSGGTLLSVSATGIHTVRMFSQTGTVAFDDL